MPDVPPLSVIRFALPAHTILQWARGVQPSKLGPEAAGGRSLECSYWIGRKAVTWGTVNKYEHSCTWKELAKALAATCPVGHLVELSGAYRLYVDAAWPPGSGTQLEPDRLAQEVIYRPSYSRALDRMRAVCDDVARLVHDHLAAAAEPAQPSLFGEAA